MVLLLAKITIAVRSGLNRFYGDNSNILEYNYAKQH